ncbi:hypothetical protein [Cobetia sp. 5-11-6-3]|uniref:hypothetical protein n=1 Tax=Cobetia sp. 5-11-6-3 TaxID=2737458 RepID=UPI00159703B5|nr:hypothetical protein [Cobetia sp. 5-11-6-3]
MSQPQYAPGMRLEVLDAEWRLTRMDHSIDGEYFLHCTGLSELVRGREASFLTRLEPNIRVLAPEKTALVDDLSPGFRAGLSNLDTQLRATASADDAVQLGHMDAMNTLDFRLEPTRQAPTTPALISIEKPVRTRLTFLESDTSTASKDWKISSK